MAWRKTAIRSSLLLKGPLLCISAHPQLWDGKPRPSNPSKPCRTTSALAGRAYSAEGQAGSALYSMAVL